MEIKKSTWQTLSKIDCKDKIEKKNGLSYLSWAWAWGIVKENFSDANYTIEYFDGKPYLFDANLGYLISTTVTIQGETIRMQLPVMDGANKAQTNTNYTYEVKEYVNGKATGQMIKKSVEKATMFDINTAIMRCLVKNLAMFGLGHYIYAGEDLPKEIPNVEALKEKYDSELQSAINIVNIQTTDEKVIEIWNKYPALQKDETFKKSILTKRKELTVVKS